LHLVGLGLAGRLKIGDLLRVVAHLFPSQWEWRRLAAMRSAVSRQSVSRHPFHGMPCAVRSTGRAELVGPRWRPCIRAATWTVGSELVASVRGVTRRRLLSFQTAQGESAP